MLLRLVQRLLSLVVRVCCIGGSGGDVLLASFAGDDDHDCDDAHYDDDVDAAVGQFVDDVAVGVHNDGGEVGDAGWQVRLISGRVVLEGDCYGSRFDCSVCVFMCPDSIGLEHS